MTDKTEAAHIATNLRDYSRKYAKKIGVDMPGFGHVIASAAFHLEDLDSRVEGLREVNHELRRDGERERTARMYAEQARAEAQGEVQRATREFEEVKRRTEATQKLLTDNIEITEKYMVWVMNSANSWAGKLSGPRGEGGYLFIGRDDKEYHVDFTTLPADNWMIEEITRTSTHLNTLLELERYGRETDQRSEVQEASEEG